MRYKTINLFGLKISFRNFKEAAIIYKDIFLGKEYLFKTDKKAPFILDCGAHIGLATLYFKKVYPRAKIIAFEPNPDTFKLLRLNIEQNNLKGVRLVNTALYNKEGLTHLYISKETKSPWTWGDATIKNPWHTTGNYKKIKVKVDRLSKYIKEKVDLIKLDVEGSETIILKEIADKLSLVKNIIMEFHGSNINKKNRLETIINILKENNFVYSIKQTGRLIDIEDIKRENPYWLIISATK